MASAGTSIASGRVATPLKRRVDEKIRRRGWLPSEVIARAYEYIDTHDDVPWMEDAASGSDALARYEALVASMPAGTPLDGMTPDDLREELAGRA